MFTLGCDPELFLFDNELQRIVPAVGKIGGTKHEPLRLTDGTVQLDGTVVEIGTDPATTSEEFLAKLDSVISEVRDMIDPRYDLRCGASAGYHPHDVASIPAHVFDVGCEPDFTLEPEDNGNYRASRRNTAATLSSSCIPVGGHLHVGFGCNLPITSPALVTGAGRFCHQLDEKDFLLASGYDLSSEAARDDVMGLGYADVVACRIKPYGVEIRNLSSYWLADRRVAVALFNYLQMSVERMQQGKKLLNSWRSLAPLTDRVARSAEAVSAKYQQTLPLDF